MQRAHSSLVLGTAPLGSPPWPTVDPFLFCVHHLDHYPRGNGRYGPDAPLTGRQKGMDFEGKDGWRMYHGDAVPGFPQHPHRGFETLTLARRGYIDHSDSLGARARFGEGDAQWMTAGRGIVHAEMFPLLHQDQSNPVELFQLWINLPRSDKMVEPHFTMLWSHTLPRVERVDEAGRRAQVLVIAGAYGEHRPPPPPPHSWASRPEADVAVWSMSLEAEARLTLPAARPGSRRMLYFFAGHTLTCGDAEVPAGHVVEVRADEEVSLHNGAAPAEILLLQGRPIDEPVAQHGPFVMNSRAELQQAFFDYQRTQFGGWPWDRADPVHGAQARRFAQHADGRLEEMDTGR